MKGIDYNIIPLFVYYPDKKNYLSSLHLYDYYRTLEAKKKVEWNINKYYIK